MYLKFIFRIVDGLGNCITHSMLLLQWRVFLIACKLGSSSPVAMSDKQCRSLATRSHTVKNTSRSKDNTSTDKTKQVTFDMKQSLKFQFFSFLKTFKQ